MIEKKHKVLLLVAELDSSRNQNITLWNSLDQADRDRSMALQDPHDRNRFILGRYLLHKAFSTLSGGAPLPAVEISGGKPFLSGSDFDFSISHASSAVAVSLSNFGRVGLDIEIRQPIDPKSISVVFSDIELAEFEKMTTDAASLACIDSWTAKEALAKLLGCPEGLDIRQIPSSIRNIYRLKTWDLEIARENYHVCLAYEGEPEILLQKERT